MNESPHILERKISHFERDNYVDVGKGIAIIAVVLGHISFDYNFLMSFWPVAFFFFVAGFYIKEEKLCDPSKFIMHKLKTIYMPGTIIYMLAISLHNYFVDFGWYPLGLSHPMTGKMFVYWDVNTLLYNIVKTIFAPNGELAMGAMWFLYSLFFALSFLSILSLLCKFVSNKTHLSYHWLRCFSIVVLASISIVLTQFGITVPRISNSITIMAVIYCGMMIKNRWNVSFNNSFCFLIAAVILLQYILLPHPWQTFPTNCFPDIIAPIIKGGSATFIVLYTSKKLNKLKPIAICLSYVGRNSLYIMALHIIGLFLCNSLLLSFGMADEMTMSASLYTFKVGNCYTLALLYLFFGLSLPLLSIELFRIIKRSIITLCKRCQS